MSTIQGYTWKGQRFETREEFLHAAGVAEFDPLAPHRPCTHLGTVTGEQVKCESCAGTRLKVYTCAVHGRCTTERKGEWVDACCHDKASGQRCLDYAPPTARFTGPLVRNLLYHIWPTQNGAWQWNVGHLLRRMSIFNGRRVVAIVTDEHTEPAQHVKDLFSGHVHEFIELPNNPKLREVVTWIPLWDRVQTSDPNHITFYAHAKGVSRNQTRAPTIKRWTEIMYAACLDDVPRVEQVLRSHALAGAFKKTGFCFRNGEYRSTSSWHYSGTFFWARNKDVFARDWRRIDQQWWGNEAWPGVMFRPDEAGCLFHENTAAMDLYSPEYMQGVEKEWSRR